MPSRARPWESRWAILRRAQKELASLQPDAKETVRLDDVLERVVLGTTLRGDIKRLGGGLLEVRLSGRREIRLAFGRVEEQPFTFVAVAVFQKQRQVERQYVETARARLSKWTTYDYDLLSGLGDS